MNDDKKTDTNKLQMWLCWIIGKLQRNASTIIVSLGIGMALTFISVLFSNYISCAFQKWFGTSGKKETLEFLGLGTSGLFALYGLLALYKRAEAQVGKLRRGLRWIISKLRRGLCWIISKLQEPVPIIIFFLGISVAIAFISVMFDDSISIFFGKGFGTLDTGGSDTNGKKETLEFLGLGTSGLFALYGLLALYKRAEAQVETNRLTEKGHVQDRFKAAVEHLSNNQPSARIASFYEFFHLAKDKKYIESILDILCAHLRHISNLKKPEDKPSEEIKTLIKPKDKPSEEIKTLIKPKDKPSEEIKTLIGILSSPEAVDIFDEFEYDLQRTNLNGIDFQKMQKSKGKVNFSFADLKEANLEKANLKEANLEEANLEKANLKEANLEEANLEEANLKEANLWRANLKEANLKEANLEEAKLRNAILEKVNLQNAILKRARLLNANLEEATLWDTNLERANLLNANLKKADLWDANLSGASAHKADLQGANLRGANLQRANLQGANLQGADLQKANLREASLQGADLRETKNLETAVLSKAKYDDETKFPEGFDPAVHGMVKYNEEDE